MLALLELQFFPLVEQRNRPLEADAAFIRRIVGPAYVVLSD